MNTIKHKWHEIKGRINHSYKTNKKEWHKIGLIALATFGLVLMIGTIKISTDLIKSQSEKEQSPPTEIAQQETTESQDEVTKEEEPSETSEEPQAADVDPNEVEEVVQETSTENAEETSKQESSPSGSSETTNQETQSPIQAEPVHEHTWVETKEEVKIIDAPEETKTYKTVTFHCSACSNVLFWDEKIHTEKDLENFNEEMSEHIANHIYTGSEDAYSYASPGSHEDVEVPEKSHWEEKGTGEYICSSCGAKR